MRKKSLYIFLILVVLFANKMKAQAESKDKAEFVSLISVIANPEKYHNKLIEIQGYFIKESEGDAIYISKSDFQNALFKNSVFLFIDEDFLKKNNIEKPYRGYMTIIGIFDMNIKGSYNFYSGTLKDLRYIGRMYKRDSKTDEFNMD